MRFYDIVDAATGKCLESLIISSNRHDKVVSKYNVRSGKYTSVTRRKAGRILRAALRHPDRKIVSLTWTWE